ncbi:MAG: hypothetical protein C0621_09160 [Desulfuromonas sp.]|nr:MAG: hypothetical protein C0621_09160 [Desulfuromonas sp.]
MRKLVLALLLIFTTSGVATAGDYDFNFSAIANDTFKTVVREAGLLSAYRGVAPAEPQGLTGFDVGVELSLVELDSKWDQVFLGGDTPGYLPVPRVHVRKGLPFGLDVGVSLTQIPESDMQVIGGELQYAILEGTTATPALSIRGSYSTVNGIDDLDLETYAADAVISKGILMFTPYAGVGIVQIDGEYTGGTNAAIGSEDFTETRVFAGVQMAIALLRLTVDAEFSQTPIYTAKLSLGW